MDTDVLLSTADACLLAPFDLEGRKLEAVFGELASRKLDFADLYFQYTRSEGWSLEEGQVKSGSFSIDQGVGVRVVGACRIVWAAGGDPGSAARRRRRGAYFVFRDAVNVAPPSPAKSTMPFMALASTTTPRGASGSSTPGRRSPLARRSSRRRSSAG